MSVIGDFTVPAESFALADALGSNPAVRLEADRIASHSPREVFPFMWAIGGDFDSFHDELASESAVESVSVDERTDDDVLYRIVWAEPFQELIHEMVDHHAAVVEAAANDRQWTLRLRFAEEEMVSSFRDHFEETGREFDVQSLWHPSGPRQREFDLTADQYEALTVAVRHGYFEIPRRVSASDLGEQLGISANAASERVRRGSAALVRSALLNGENADPF